MIKVKIYLLMISSYIALAVAIYTLFTLSPQEWSIIGKSLITYSIIGLTLSIILAFKYY